MYPSVFLSSPGRHAEVLLYEVAGDGQRQQGDEEDGRHVADDAQGGDAQQGGAGEALQRGGDVLVDGVGVGGEPVEDAAQGGGLEQPGGQGGGGGQGGRRATVFVPMAGQEARLRLTISFTPSLNWTVNGIFVSLEAAKVFTYSNMKKLGQNSLE